MPDFLHHRPSSTTEAAVASLARLGIPGDRIDVVPVGPLERYRGEIVGQVPDPGAALDSATHVTLYVSRLGLAERLPGDLLEPVPTAKDATQQALEPGQAEDYWHRQVLAYGPGRRLVTVMDRSLQRLHRDLDQVGWSLAALSQDDTYAGHVLGLVHLDSLPLSREERVFLATELQRLPDRVGTRSGVASILSAFLGVPVTVHERPGPLLSIPDDERRPLGTSGCRLGGELALGPTFRDSRPSLLVELGPLPLAEFVAMQQDERWRAKADALLAMAAPASSQAEWRLVLREDDRGSRLGDRQRGRLGSTTWLAA